MAKPQTLEILISRDGENKIIIAHNFHGKGCEEAVKAFSSGEVISSKRTREYYQPQSQERHQEQEQ